MNSIVVISCLLVATVSAGFLPAVPHVTTTQYHSQDEIGQYSYGYSGGPSAKEETRTADGVTRGSYSYIDANGIVQSASYVSDPVHGFRVAATNLPQAPPAVISGPSGVVGVDAGPVVAAVRAAPVVAPAHVAVAPRIAIAPARIAPVAVAPARIAPVAVAPAHVAVAAAPARFVQHAPGFDYANGVPLETPEVAAAKAAHFAAHGEALARLHRRWKRSLVAPIVDTGKAYSVVTPSGSTTVVSGPSVTGKAFSYSTVSAAPVVSAAPAIAYSAPAAHGYVAPVVKSFSYSAPAVVAPATATVVTSPFSRSFSYSSIGSAPVVAAAPAVVAAAPAVVASPAVAYSVPLSSQYQAQDEHGQYSYGYSDGFSSKTESRTADGITHGKYSYLDSNGIVQSVKYVADAAGFRVHATNLPVGPTHG